ncbi:MAG TPA: HAMP domain-containing sensor histidine kinase [Thermoguttaceae bacterium]|nr:HAMP domain-containing sensor histidine kinase [Thermoguttaceae bacterium]
MSARRSLRLPITLAIVMIVLLIVLTVGWVLLNVFGALGEHGYAGLYWALLSVGTTFIVLLVVGVILYLVLSIKTINLNRRQSNFIDSVTHELKSPIASMKLYLQTLNRHQVSERQQASFYQFMLEDVERLDHLINQIMDAGRLETGPLDGEAEDVALAEVLQECAETVCLSYRVSLQIVRMDLQPCTVRARRIDLEMIFRNLIDNAVKYAAAQPQVEVTLRPSTHGRIVTQIADNGRGIPPPMRRKIFGRFVRLGMELEREKPGTGLGLYIVRTLLRRLGGRIRVRDRQQGPGTVFEVQLPGVPAEETVENTEETAG